MANEVVAMPSYAAVQIRENGSAELHTIGDAIGIAKFLHEAGMLPIEKGAQMAAVKAAAAVFLGNSLGLDPLASVQNIAVINGKPSVWGDAIGGLVSASGLCEDEWKEEVGDGENYKVVYHVRRKGRTHEYTAEFGYKDAVRAHLWGKSGPWTDYPKRMMLYRARAFAYRDAFPDVLKGIRIAEEERDAPIDITGNVSVSESPLSDKPKVAPAAAKRTDAKAVIAAANASTQKGKADAPKADKPAPSESPAEIFAKKDKKPEPVPAAAAKQPPAKADELPLG